MDELSFLTTEELEQVRQWIEGDYLGGAPGFEGGPVWQKLYDHYVFETHEMPYGTAKGRTGDPYEWVFHRVEGMF